MNHLLVIPIFIPHAGCRHNCVFCDQNRITGQRTARIAIPQIRATIKTWLDRHWNPDRREQVQIAFYGGSFTALPASEQEELLAEACRWLRLGVVHTIRLSTRPDCIDRPVLSLLKRYRVGIVELGVQSMDNRVLAAAGRGHTADHTRLAFARLREEGFLIGAQLMLGLPAETRKSIRKTTAEILALRPDFVRIYPVLVLRGTRLAAMYRQGRYQPLSLARAIVLAATMRKDLEQGSIPVIRMGLQPGQSLEKSLVAGPHHPAFGELVRSRHMEYRIRRALAPLAAGQTGLLLVSEQDRSLFSGHGGILLRRLERLGMGERFSLRFLPTMQRDQVRLVSEGTEKAP